MGYIDRLFRAIVNFLKFILFRIKGAEARYSKKSTFRLNTEIAVREIVN